MFCSKHVDVKQHSVCFPEMEKQICLSSSVLNLFASQIRELFLPHPVFYIMFRNNSTSLLYFNFCFGILLHPCYILHYVSKCFCVLAIFYSLMKAREDICVNVTKCNCIWNWTVQDKMTIENVVSCGSAYSSWWTWHVIHTLSRSVHEPTEKANHTEASVIGKEVWNLRTIFMEILPVSLPVMYLCHSDYN